MTNRKRFRPRVERAEYREKHPRLFVPRVERKRIHYHDSRTQSRLSDFGYHFTKRIEHKVTGGYDAVREVKTK